MNKYQKIFIKEINDRIQIKGKVKFSKEQPYKKFCQLELLFLFKLCDGKKYGIKTKMSTEIVEKNRPKKSYEELIRVVLIDIELAYFYVLKRKYEKAPAALERNKCL